MPSYTYELVDPELLLSRVRADLKSLGGEWESLAENLVPGHVEYRPIRANPMKSGYRYQYQRAGLNLNVYLPEKQFEVLLQALDRDHLMTLKSAFQRAIPQRSGYIINEFKIRGILEGPESSDPVAS